MSKSAASRVLPARIGRYEVLTTLGEGGLATVYLGRVRGPGGYEREVALKVLHRHLRGEDELTDALIAEAKIVSRIRHPNVVQVLDVEEDEHGVFVVMERVRGAALSQLMAKAAKSGAKTLPRPVALKILVDVLGGLHAAHELVDEDGRPTHLVHRDVSPQNILVGDDGVARLIDFGIAKFERRELKTRTGLIKGKVAYMAPEQVRARPLDRRCDVWAAGVIAWELLAGRRLFKTDDEMATLFEVATGEVPALRDFATVPAALEEAVRAALARDVEARLGTAEQLAERLEAASEGLATTHEVARYVASTMGDTLRAEEARVASAMRDRLASAASPEPPASPAETTTTHALPEKPAAAPASRSRIPIVVAAVVLAGGGSAWLATRVDGAPVVEAPAPAASSPVVVVANAPIAELHLNGRRVELPLASESIEVMVDSSATAIAIEATATDGRTARHVTSELRDRVILTFADPAPAGEATAVAPTSTPAPSSPPASPMPVPRPPAVKGARPHDDPPVGPSPYGKP